MIAARGSQVVARFVFSELSSFGLQSVDHRSGLVAQNPHEFRIAYLRTASTRVVYMLIHIVSFVANEDRSITRRRHGTATASAELPLNSYGYRRTFSSGRESSPQTS